MQPIIFIQFSYYPLRYITEYKYFLCTDCEEQDTQVNSATTCRIVHNVGPTSPVPDGHNNWAADAGRVQDAGVAEVPPIQGRNRDRTNDTWSDIPVPNPPARPVFSGDPRVTATLDHTSDEYDCFSVFFDKDIVVLVKQETNRYASTIIAKLRRTNKLKPNSLWNKWSPVKVHEVYNFFSIILHMCTVWKANLSDYWSTKPFIHSTFASKLLSRDRFKSIMAMLHINNNETYVPRNEPHYDPLHKIRPYFDFLIRKFKCSFSPSENLTIDEGMCAFRGRIHFRVYMKNKPEKYGMKLYIICDAESGYALNIELYTGKGDIDNSIVPLMGRLLQDYLGKGHTVYMDRFYTSPTVMDYLWSHDTLGVGTVMINRKQMPKDLKEIKLKKGEMTFRHRPNLLACKWKDTRDVVILSSKHGASCSEVSVKARGGPVRKFKPDAVIDYNLNKTGVDRNDQLVSYYPFNRKSMKWWKKMFFHLFIRSVVNSFILFKKTRENPNHSSVTLYNFMIAVGEKLGEMGGQEVSSANPATSADRLSGRHFPRKLPPTEKKERPCRSCKVCGDRSKQATGKWARKDTTFFCPSCDVALCVPECFEMYHTRAKYV